MKNKFIYSDVIEKITLMINGQFFTPEGLLMRG